MVPTMRNQTAYAAQDDVDARAMSPHRQCPNVDRDARKLIDQNLNNGADEVQPILGALHSLELGGLAAHGNEREVASRLEQGGKVEAGRKVEASPEAVSLERTACLSSLPYELIDHVALWLHSVTDLAQMQCVDHWCRDGSSARMAQLSQLLSRFPRLKHILWHAACENLCPRPLNFDTILAQQHAADIEQQHVAGVLQEMPHAEQLDPALLLTVEMRYLTEFALWSGSPKHAFDVTGACRGFDGCRNVKVGPIYRPRLWKERPEWINELNRLIKDDEEAADRGWNAIHVRVFLTRGVHSIKVLDATHGVGQENSPWLVDDDKSEGGATVWQSDKSWPFAYVGSGNEETCVSFPFCMSDDGYFELWLWGNAEDGTDYSWFNMCGILNNLWPFTTTTKVDAVKGIDWWNTAWLENG